ncbi:hypothetical protein BaRGS_00024645 [Batillaria attramentaria]|uniref:Uncharacterized protein n=1 Tax=Batillaria attramentaria TaxID=370345 RepID=A0ABD0KAM1_9CAEN
MDQGTPLCEVPGSLVFAALFGRSCWALSGAGKQQKLPPSGKRSSFVLKNDFGIAAEGHVVPAKRRVSGRHLKVILPEDVRMTFTSASKFKTARE